MDEAAVSGWHHRRWTLLHSARRRPSRAHLPVQLGKSPRLHSSTSSLSTALSIPGRCDAKPQAVAPGRAAPPSSGSEPSVPPPRRPSAVQPRRPEASRSPTTRSTIEDEQEGTSAPVKAGIVPAQEMAEMRHFSSVACPRLTRRHAQVRDFRHAVAGFPAARRRRLGGDPSPHPP